MIYFFIALSYLREGRGTGGIKENHRIIHKLTYVYLVVYTCSEDTNIKLLNDHYNEVKVFGWSEYH